MGMSLKTLSDYVASTIAGGVRPAYVKLSPDDFDGLVGVYVENGVELRSADMLIDGERPDNIYFRGIPMVLDHRVSLPEAVYA